MFRYDSTFSEMVRKALSCFLLSALWLLSCIPVLTAGAGTAALCYAVEMYLIRGESYPWTCFFKAFRRDFLQATLLWLAVLAAGLFLSWDLYFFWKLLENGNSEGTLALVIVLLLAFLVLAAVYGFFYLSRFCDSLSRVLKNALLLTLPHPLINLRILALLVLLAVSAVYKPMFLTFLPALSCWLVCRSMDKLFGKIVPDSVQPEEAPAAE